MVVTESYLTAASGLVGAGALWLSRHQAMRQAQVQVLVDVGGEYRQAWRTRWRDLPKAVADVDGDLTGLADPTGTTWKMLSRGLTGSASPATRAYSRTTSSCSAPSAPPCAP